MAAEKFSMGILPPPDPELEGMLTALRDDLIRKEKAALGDLADLPFLFPGKFKITREWHREQIDTDTYRLVCVTRIHPIELVSIGGDIVARDARTGEYV